MGIMDTVPVPGARSTISWGSRGPVISIPARRNVFVLVLLPLWMVGWAFGEIAVLRILREGLEGPGLFLLVWFVFWTIGGVLAVVAWLWMIGGREILELHPSRLVQRHVLFGLARSRAFDVTNVRNVRVSPEMITGSTMNWGWRGRGVLGGMIAFDYGAGTVRIAGQIDEGEAATIVRAIEERYGPRDRSDG